MRKSRNQNPSDVVSTIDNILTHHYFHEKLDQILQQKNMNNKFGGVDGLLQDQYYKPEADIIQQISSTMEEIISKQVRNIINTEYVNINEQISAIKQEIFSFTGQQHKITEGLKKQVFRVSEELRRKSLVSGISSNVNSIQSGPTGIRFMRNSQKHSQIISAIGESTQKKSYHSQIVEIRKQIDKIKQSVENMEGVKMLRQQFNQYKLQNKIQLQTLNQQFKKINQMGPPKRPPSASKTNHNNANDNIKQYIQVSVKRSLKALSNVYSGYAQQISQLKQFHEQLKESLESLKEQNIEYFSKQLKSVWMIINDLKRNVDSIVQRNNLDMSMQIL